MGMVLILSCLPESALPKGVLVDSQQVLGR